MKFNLTSVCSVVLVLLLGNTAAQVCGAQREAIEQNLYPRTLEMLDVGYQLPIEIVAVRHLQKRKHWIRDLEIEIKNVSAKPIYGVWLTLVVLDDNERGAPSAVDLKYGRSDVLHSSGPASTDDKPIGRGETTRMKVADLVWMGYKAHLRNERVPESATHRLRVLVVEIGFGDGTGFINCGVPYPNRPARPLRPQRYVKVPIDFK